MSFLLYCTTDYPGIQCIPFISLSWEQQETNDTKDNGLRKEKRWKTSNKWREAASWVDKDDGARLSGRFYG